MKMLVSIWIAAAGLAMAQSPEVHPDRSVTFQLRAPDANKVQVRIGKAYDMTKAENGVWSVTTPPLVVGFHYYSLVVDGVEVNDPASETFFGSDHESSGIEIPEPGADYYEVKDVAHGQVRQRRYFSTVTGAWRRCFIYTPPDYDSNPAKRYPVLYLHHGWGEDEWSWVVQGRVDAIMDNLFAAGKAKPMIIVMENHLSALKPGEQRLQLGGGRGRGAARPDFSNFGATYTEVMLKDLIPMVEKNYRAVDQTIANLMEVKVPAVASSKIKMPPIVAKEAPDFVHRVTAEIIAGRGDKLPVSAFPVDGTFPTATAQWEKRNIAMEIPVWYTDLCIQCNKCALVCPHAAIRAKVADPKALANQPATLKSMKYKGKEFDGQAYMIQVAPEDCTGCTLCVEVCPGKDKKDPSKRALMMAPQMPLRAAERENYAFFLNIPEVDRSLVKVDTVKGSQFLQPLFEYSGACSGCGETPYYKLLTQLFGDRAIIANATGCSSIYGGNLPTTPFAKNKDGRGPAWNNSLFEDNAEFGLGYRLTIDKQNDYAKLLLKKLGGKLPGDLVTGLLDANQADEAGIFAQRERVVALKQALAKLPTDSDAKNLLTVADVLVKKSVWIVGGDGWAYDIGYGGLDHVVASGRNVNILVLDTEVYSNTGGQCSKATPTGAVAKFAAAGKPTPKKDLGMMAIAYRNCYVAKVAMGYSDIQTVRAFIEADAYDGPSIIIAYSHCIAHGIDMAKGMDNQTAAVDSGAWTLYRFNPDLYNKGEHPLKLDSKAPKMTYEQWAMTETRFRSLAQVMPERARALMEQGQREAKARWKLYEALAIAGVDSPFAPPAGDKLVS